MPKAKASSKPNGSAKPAARRRGSRPAPAPAAVLDAAGAGIPAAAAEGVPAGRPGSIVPGVMVRITGGDWKGASGRVDSLHGQDRCLVFTGPRFPLANVRLSDCTPL